jgi:hypothetical protein
VRRPTTLGRRFSTEESPTWCSIYPNQVAASVCASNVYPYTILVTAPGTKIGRYLVTNAYNFLNIEVGRVIVKIDHAYDHVTPRDIYFSVWWDTVGNQPYPHPIDTWVMNKGTALVVGRMDSLEMSEGSVFVRFTGMLLTDSTDIPQPPCGYGTEARSIWIRAVRSHRHGLQ